MELAEAYVTIRADIAELKKALAAARQETEKATSYMDKQAARLTSAFMRMGGGITAIRVATSALAGMFEEIKAEKAFDTAQQTGNLNAMIAAYQRADMASRRWMEAIPFLGASLSQLSQAFRDDSIIQFAQRLEITQRQVKAAGFDVDELAKAEIRLAEAKDMPKAKIVEMRETLGARISAREYGEKYFATQAAERDLRTAEQKRIRAEKAAPTYGWTWTARRKIRELELAQTAEATARITWIEAKRGMREIEKARPIETAAAQARIESARQIQLGTMPAGAGMPPPGMPLETDEAINLLREIRDNTRDVDRLK